MSSLSGAHYEADFPVPASQRMAGKEAELLKRAQGGDRSAFGQIVVLYQDRLYNALLRVVGDAEEARDLTQETFTRALMKIDSFRGEAGPYTWLFRIGVNLAISQLRKLKRHRVFSLDRPSSGNGQAADSDDQASGLLDRVTQDRGAAPDESAETREEHQEVLSALGRLDAEYRAVLVMRDIEGFDYQQMAEVLSLPLGGNVEKPTIPGAVGAAG
jgi:RNA polymerase sigma-70 factor (ECF subfamily)